LSRRSGDQAEGSDLVETEGRTGSDGGGGARFREADPDDAAFIARAILSASRGHSGRGLWDVVVDGPEDDRRDFLEYLALLEEKSFCHYSGFVIAERDGERAAAMSAYDPGASGLLMAGHAIALVFQELALGDDRLAQAYDRLAVYERGLPEQKPGVWTIEWVWTEPRHRGKGLVTALLAHLLDRGRKLGFARAQVTAFLGNAAGVRRYEEAGFRIAEERRDAKFESLLGFAGMARYERDL
jgi:ribosomal protein S18 acetylase RimI-like enzyme